MNEQNRAGADFVETHRRIVAALREAGHTDTPADLVPADAALIKRVPDWVACVGIVEDRDGYWMLVSRRPLPNARSGAIPDNPAGAEPRSSETGSGRASAGDASAASPAAGQFVMEIEAGRYFVETLDVETHAWISRESASGSPLVAGLVCPASAVVVRIRRASSAVSRSQS